MKDKKEYQTPVITLLNVSDYDILTASSGYDPEGASFDDYDFNEGAWW